MKIAYFDCFAGAAGDMIVAAMIHAGLDRDLLIKKIKSLNLPEVHINFKETTRNGIGAMSFIPEIHHHHDHHHDHDHHHRPLSEIIKIIDSASLKQPVKDRAIAVFRNLGQAEAEIHRKTIEEIHFHEVGAADAIVDIVSACVGLDALGIEKVYCSALSVGGGTVKCQHGIIPVPAPATAKLLARANAPIIPGPAQKELLTPTAAAILTNFSSDFGPLPPMQITSIGYGAGTMEFDHFPNLLRLIIGESADSAADIDSVYLLECNVDDATGEIIGMVTKNLIDAGALDVYTTAIQMKQNRPAVKVSILCKPDKVQQTEQIIFEQGLTLGIRKHLLQRSKLERRFDTVSTEYGNIRIKTGIYKGKIVCTKPEYSDCTEATQKHSVPLKTVQQAALKAFESSKSQ